MRSKRAAVIISSCLVAVVARGEEVFHERLPHSGIGYRNVSGELDKRFIVSSLGSGAALFDYDADGDLDLYLVNGARLDGMETIHDATNRLYRNEGAFDFADVTEMSGAGDRGWGLGVAAGDYDNDGFVDLYVTNLGANLLFRNRGDGTFARVADDAGVGHTGFGTSTLFFDPDRDGDLDLYVANYSESDVSALPLPGERPSCVWFGEPVFCGPTGLRGIADVYYRNDNDTTFADVTSEAGLLGRIGAYGLGVVAGDVDDDGDPDLYVANDSVPNFLFQNDGTGRFTDAALYSGVAYNADGLAQAGMGVDLADLDGDAALDILVTNFSHDTNTWYRNAGSGIFADATTSVDLRTASWFYLGWAIRIADFDNDGAADVFVANGHVYPEASGPERRTSYRQRNQLFWNRGGSLEEAAFEEGDPMLAEASSRGAAFGDLDDDGDMDIVVVNIDDAPALLQNVLGGSSVTLTLVGRASNRSAIGARIAAGDRVLEVRPSGSYLSSSDPRVHIGMGERASVDVTIRWPSGRVQTIGAVSAGERRLILEPRE